MTNAVKAIILNKDNKILILEQIVHECTFYSLPGGRIQGSANAIDELKREIKEETGLGFTSYEYIGHYAFERDDGSSTNCKTYLIKEYYGEISSTEKEDYELIKFIWMVPSEFVEKYADSESLKNLIKRLIKKKVLK